MARQSTGGEDSQFELYFPDHQHIVIGMPGQLAKYLRHESPKTGPLSNGLKLAASGKPVVLSVNIGALPIPPRELAGLPAEVKPLLKAEHVTASLDLGATAKIDLVAGYKNIADAQDAELAVKTLAELGRKEIAKLKGEIEKKLFDPKAKSPRPGSELPETVLSIFALGAINQLDEMLANPGALVKREGSELAASVALPKEVIVAAGGFATVGCGIAESSRPEGADGCCSRTSSEQSETDRSRLSQLRECIRPLATGYHRQEWEAAAQLACGDTPVHRTTEPIHAVQAR